MPCRTPGLSLSVLLMVLTLTGGARAGAEEALVAVAANFAEAAEALAKDFEATTDHKLTLTTGSTGKLFAQIQQGAPFDALLAADQARPARLEAEGDAVAGSRFTFAVGRLTLWSSDADRIGEDGLAVLRAGDFEHLALANPDLAPYGLAAKQALEHFELWTTLQPKLVMGQDVGQAFSMVATGNAQLGLVAKSSVLSERHRQTGSSWDVPPQAHEPILQDAVLLKAGAGNTAAREFLSYLRTAGARSVIERFGYGTE
jgi:molybdate transport system substrate-binding protein